MRDSLRDSALPIWVSLARSKVAVYRDVKGTYYRGWNCASTTRPGRRSLDGAGDVGADGV